MSSALSPHFSLDEMIFSQTAVRNGIDNTPPPEIIERLRHTASSLEIIRGLLRQPIIITSGYRSPLLNRTIGGSPNSAHTKGYAADFICPAYGTPLKICKAIEAAKIQFDQLICEGGAPHGWVHVSFSIPMRQELLTANFTGTETHYTGGLA